MSRTKTLRLILGDQLNEAHSWFKTPDRQVTYVMMEVRQETDYVAHHIQKVAAFFAAMRAFADRLVELGHQVIYIKLDDPDNRQTLDGNIANLLRRKKFTRFEYLLPDEHRLDLQLREMAEALPVSVETADTQHFLTERQELADFFAGKKRYLMESFYRWMRKRYDVLMDNGKPVGDRWNFDQKNRQAYDGQVPIPKPLFFTNDVSKIEIQQIEGYVRQVLGWREYMRGIYWRLMPEFAEMNYFDHQAALPEFYWTGQTRLRCLGAAIGQSLKHAYAHHIQRLMVTGNFALLAGVHPDYVEEWYLGIYIDAIQWVEMPNTRAMSQFADGGLVATKPYISSAKYIHSMSDYCDSCEYDWKKRHGEMACPFNSLYWHFFERHRSLLKKNPRVGMMYRTWDRMADREKKRILKQANTYLKKVDNL